MHARSQMVPEKFRRLRLQWADLLLTVSEGVRRQAIAGGMSKEKVVTLYSGIDPRKVQVVSDGQRIRRAYSISVGSLVIGSVANIVPKKGYDILIRAVAKARQEINDLVCLIVGADERGLQRGLERLGASLGLDGRLCFAGFQHDVFPYLDAMDLFALASVEEGFGIVLLEAMACAKPVLATRVDGPPEIVEDGRTGLLVPPGDPDAMAHALVELLNDPERRARMGKQGQERIETVFGLDLQMRTLIGLYDQLLARLPGKSERRG